MPPIKIVYYVYLNAQSNWQDIITQQLTQLKSYGILDVSTLYLHITDCENLSQQAKLLVSQIVPDAIINTSTVNQYEYQGIKLVHDLAKQYPESIFLYFHTKGMSYNTQKRDVREEALLRKTFSNWQRAITELNKPGMNKAGLFFGKYGWVWYNFWYAKGHYLTTCTPPVLTDNRYAYEDWLGRASAVKVPGNTDCVHLLSLDGISSKTEYEPVDADQLLDTLTIKKGKLSNLWQKLIKPFNN